MLMVHAKNENTISFNLISYQIRIQLIWELVVMDQL